MTSHIIVTFALAAAGHRHRDRSTASIKHGLHFLQLFVPLGVPGVAAAAAGVIEVISFVSRPISLSFVFSPTCWPATSP